MSADFARKVMAIVETGMKTRPASVEFELAYQTRTAADRIRFAITEIDEAARHSDQIRNASLQLLDALDRLESADRHFQEGWRRGKTDDANESIESIEGVGK
jgi:hypothetical protein